MSYLYDYQVKAIDELRAGFQAGHYRQILCLPTGGGKTVVAGAMIEEAVRRGRKVIFLADRIALVDQTSMRLSELGIEHGIAQGENTIGRTLPVQVCSAATIEKREYWPDADLIIVDECHSIRKKTKEFLSHSKAMAIGLSATPLTKGLGDIYSNVVSPVSTDELIEKTAQKQEGERGYLVPLKTYVATEIDMTGAPTSAGEWSSATVSSRAIPIVGDIVADWVKHTQATFGGPVKTLVFSATVDDGTRLCQEFQAAGYRFEQVSYRDVGDARRRRIEDFRAGRIMGLVSVEALAKGFDVPDVLCMSLARPYRKSVAAHIQQIGRGMRWAEGKQYCLALDHSGNIMRHAAATERIWASGVESLLPEYVEKIRVPPERDDSERVCPKCDYVKPAGAEICPMCGYVNRRAPNLPEYVPGQMTEYVRLADVGDGLWCNLSRLAIDRYPGDWERARRFALAQYKAIEGKWPPYGIQLQPSSEPCDARVEARVVDNLRRYQKRMIRQGYAERRARAA